MYLPLYGARHFFDAAIATLGEADQKVQHVQRERDRDTHIIYYHRHVGGGTTQTRPALTATQMRRASGDARGRRVSSPRLLRP